MLRQQHPVDARPPTPTSAITPATTALAVTQTQTYTLTATPTPTTVTWVSSNTNALTIDSGGTATAVGVGAATITATGDAAQTATLTVQTVPLYQGNWTGTATVLACTDLAGFTAAGYCAKNLGTTQQVTLSLTQSGLDPLRHDDQGGRRESHQRFGYRARPVSTATSR